MDPIEIIHKTPKLKAVFSKFLEKNTSNDACYHNLWHTLCMVRYCYEGAKAEGLSDDKTTDLLVAALIHDMCHSQGERTDTENVKKAIWEGFHLYEDTDYFYGGILSFNRRIGKIIKATEYPYVIPAEELTPQQAIIRDADLFQSFEDTWFTHTTVGLAKELKIDLKKFVPLEIEFVKNAEFNTSWGQSKAFIEIPKLLDKLEKLVELLGVPVTYTKENERIEWGKGRMEREAEREKFFQEKIESLYAKYPISTFNLEIEKIEAQGYEVTVSTESAQVWKKTEGERSATDLVIDADFADTYNDNLVMMIDAFYNNK